MISVRDQASPNYSCVVDIAPKRSRICKIHRMYRIKRRRSANANLILKLLDIVKILLKVDIAPNLW